MKIIAIETDVDSKSSREEAILFRSAFPNKARWAYSLPRWGEGHRALVLPNLGSFPPRTNELIANRG